MTKCRHYEDELVLLQTYRSFVEADEVLQLLRREGIEGSLESLYTHMILGAAVDVGGIRLMVPREDADRALDVLRANGKELPHPEQSAVAKLNNWLASAPVLRNLSLKRALLLLIVVLALVLFLLLLIIQTLSPS